MARPGAAGPAAGISAANDHEATASATMTPTTSSALLASATAMPPAMVPIRMARNVAPSTSALPAGSSAVCELLGQDAVFHRAEQRRDHAEQAERHEQDRHRVQEEAGRGERGDGNLGELDPLARRSALS